MECGCECVLDDYEVASICDVVDRRARKEQEHQRFYTFRQRTLNEYWVITQLGWDLVVKSYANEPYVCTCGRNATTHACVRCGTCLREFYATRERMRTEG